MADRTLDVTKLASFLPTDAFDVGEHRVHLRLATRRDASEWSALRVGSREHLERWEPQLAEPWDETYSPGRLKRTLRAQKDAAKAGRQLTALVDVDGHVAGEVSLGGIVRGANQSGWLGYWLGERFAGRGIGTVAVALAMDLAFGPLRLERVEATVKPDNAPSIAVLRRAGFLEEGRLRNYLRIGGARRDHLLYAALVSERMMPAVKELELAGRARRAGA